MKKFFVLDDEPQKVFVIPHAVQKPKKGLFWRVVRTLHSALGKLLELKPENEHGLQK
jgi:hypothetical protein